jgi:hypothetical protein
MNCGVDSTSVLYWKQLKWMNKNNSVAGGGLDDMGVILSKSRDFSLHHHFQNSCGF